MERGACSRIRESFLPAPRHGQLSEETCCDRTWRRSKRLAGSHADATRRCSKRVRPARARWIFVRAFECGCHRRLVRGSPFFRGTRPRSSPPHMSPFSDRVRRILSFLYTVSQIKYIFTYFITYFFPRFSIFFLNY